MQVKIISFDEVLDSMKSGNIKNIYIVDILDGYIQNLSTEEIGSLLRDIKDKIFIQAEFDGEWYGVDKCKR